MKCMDEQLDDGTRVTDELEYNPTSLAGRLDTAEMEAGKYVVFSNCAFVIFL